MKLGQPIECNKKYNNIFSVFHAENEAGRLDLTYFCFLNKFYTR